MRALKVALMGAALLLSGCGYNKLQTQDEAVEASWAEMLSPYQQRAALIHKLVAPRKGTTAPQANGTCGRTQRRAIRRELPARAFLAAVERYRRKAAGVVKVAIDILRVEGGVPGAKTRPAAQARLDLGHQRVAVAARVPL